MPLLKERRLLSIAAETTAGTPVALTTGQIFVFDPILQPTIPETERNATGTLGQLVSVPGTQMAKLTFSIELTGGGATNIEPAWATLLFPACGMAQVGSTHVYQPTSNPGNYKTLTMGVYMQTATGCILKKMAGSMGTFTLDCEDGKPPMLKFEFSGVYLDPTSATYPTNPPFPIVPPRFANATFSLTPTNGSAYTPKISKFNLDYGATIKMREDISTLSGFASAIVTERKPTGSFDPEADDVASYAPYAQLSQGITSAMVLTYGTGTGFTVSLTSPAFQVVGATESNRDLLVTDEIRFALRELTADGELTVTFS